MIYSYYCNFCGPIDSSLRQEHIKCPSCGSLAKRKFQISFSVSSFRPHYNIATGRYVSTDKEFRLALRQTSDDNSLKTNTLHLYLPIYPGLFTTPSLLTQAIENHMKAAHDGD